MATIYHIPAMPDETIAGLNIRPDGIYVDVTFGGGGHSRAILDRLGEGGRLYSFDQDLDALHNGFEDARWQFVHANFRYLQNFMDYYGVSRIDGLLADLGVSFHHFDEAERGFSFRFAGPLDMRMNRQAAKTAADIVNNYSEEELARVLYIYGELKNAKSIAHRIVTARSEQALTRIEHLIGILDARRGALHDLPDGTDLDIDARNKKDLARLFQALRIEVNDELGALPEMLNSARELLNEGGRIAILTYHSLEDRIVKNFLRSGNIDGTIEKDFYGNCLSPFKLIEKGLSASEEEVARNPRARSAKLRVAEKIQIHKQEQL